MKLANRTEELRLFLHMLRGEIEQRILLIEAPSGYGKTNLLEQFAANCPKNVYPVIIDLKSADTGIAYLFSRVQRRLGLEKFPTFEKELQRFFSAGVEIADNEISGQENRIQVVLQAEDEQRRKLRLSRLQSAFFEDLRRCSQQILLILDTFEKAPEELANWINGGFLTEISETSNVMIVIAGQRVPQPSIEWRRCHEYRRLNAILEEDAWCDYLEYRELPLSRDVIKAIILVFNGLPAEVIKAFETLARQQS